MTTTLVRREQARAGSGAGQVARLHLAMTAGLTAVTIVGSHLLLNRWAPRRVRAVALDWFVGGWVRWDGWWYVNIAARGYTYRPGKISSVAFFPVYPLLVRALASLVPIGPALAAIAITVTCGGLALQLFHRWCAARCTPAAARAGVVTLALYPFAWFLFGAAYSDALFLCLALGAFLALEADRPWLVALLGAIATATRPTGITLVIGLAVLAWGRWSRRRVLAVALSSLTGLATWCAWLWLRFGDPLVFIDAEGAPGWNQPPGPQTWFKLSFFRLLSRYHGVEIAEILFQALLAIAFLAAAPAVARRFGRGYGWYVAVTTLVPAISTADLLGVGRYVLPAFPVFALVGERLQERPALRPVAWGLSAAALVAGTTLFSAGYLVA